MTSKNIAGLVLRLCLFVELGAAQGQKPLALDAVTDSMAVNELKINNIVHAIDELGIAFNLDEANLTAIVDAGRKGERPPTEVSTVIWHLVKACRTCRDMFWSPLTAPELVSWVKIKGSASALEELKVRGSDTLPVSIDYIDELRKAGAKPELIAAVEDRLKIIPADGYRPIRLDKAPSFDPQAKSGKLIIRAEIDEEVEFMFRHNALFWKATRGTEPKDMGCNYTAFGPFSAADPGWTVKQVTNPKAKKPKKVPIISQRKFVDSSGRPTLVVSVNDVEPGTHDYELEVSWNR